MQAVLVNAFIKIKDTNEYELQFLCRKKSGRVTYKLTGNFNEPVKTENLTIDGIKIKKEEKEGVDEFTTKLNTKLSVFAEKIIRYYAIFKNPRRFIFVMEMEEKQLAA